MRKINEIQADIDSTERAIQSGGVDQSQIDLWNVQLTDFRKEMAEAESHIQAHEVKLQEATESIGYILDTMTIEGLTIAELITDDDIYKLVRAGVQNAYVEQAEKNLQAISEQQALHQAEIKAIMERVSLAEGKAEQLQSANSDLEVKNYQLTIENDELSNKVTKGAELLNDANSQIEQQKTHIEELQTQIAIGVRGALNVVHVPQDTSKIAEEIRAKKVRITDVKYQDETGIDRRIKTAVEVLTGKEISYEAIYEKRYIILNLEEAAQYRAEIEQKKAEEEAQNAVIPTIETIEYVTEEVEPVTEIPFQATVEDTDSQGDSADVRNESMEQVVEQESEVITLESLNAEIIAIKTHLGLAA
jgi:hypothetical protein